eukprot:TRINITY_DN4400_c0_g1_i1.p1 TRINITY_DN4400_c0_g1~~TRINITY_DN4400_c0_g1_i1.p1  ORF type:complete len:641 (-),score=174.32 TRINITY_DN4400_c0_g1_i1:33-1955(-)
MLVLGSRLRGPTRSVLQRPTFLVPKPSTTPYYIPVFVPTLQRRWASGPTPPLPTFSQDPKGWCKRLPKVIYDGVVHLVMGFRLLFLNVATAVGIAFRSAKGKTLTRRERRLLVTTTSDIMRLIPFSIFVIVPFMELLLPVALKLFPNMMPSTFTTKDEAEAKRIKELKAKIELAKFVQDTVNAVKSSSETFEGNFRKFLQDVHERGPMSKEQTLNFVKTFKDDLTLSNLKRSQILQMCKFIGINNFGPTNFLRYHLHNRIQELKRDDKMIKAEGLSSLSLVELKNACAARGISSLGTREKLEADLADWLNLSLDLKVPTGLLILSRAFRLYAENQPKRPDEIRELRETIKYIPTVAIENVESDVIHAQATTQGDLAGQLKALRDEREKMKEEQVEADNKEKELTEIKSKGGNVGFVDDMPTDDSKILEARDIVVPLGKLEKSTLLEIEESVIESIQHEGNPSISRLSEKLKGMCARLETAIASHSMTPDSHLTIDEMRERLQTKGWTNEEIDSFIAKLDVVDNAVSVANLLKVAEKKVKILAEEEAKRLETYETRVTTEFEKEVAKEKVKEVKPSEAEKAKEVTNEIKPESESEIKEEKANEASAVESEAEAIQQKQDKDTKEALKEAESKEKREKASSE